MNEEGHFISIATKVAPYAYERFKRLCKAKGLSEYGTMQMAFDALIRYMDDAHNLTPEMERMMLVFEHMIGWKDALNLCDPAVKKEIGEAVYFLYDSEGKKHGTRAVHVKRPNFEDWEQDMNVQHIIERCICLLFPDRYKRLRQLGAAMGCSSILDILDRMIDHHTKEEDNAEIRREFEDAARHDFGQEWQEGERPKNRRDLTPDMFETLNIEDYGKKEEDNTSAED